MAKTSKCDTCGDRVARRVVAARAPGLLRWRSMHADQQTPVFAHRGQPGHEIISRDVRHIGGAASPLIAAEIAIREGRFQRWLSLIAGAASTLGGVEAALQHYKGSYSRRIMYTPVALSVVLAAAGIAGFFSRRAARTALPAASILTLADCLVGFGFHIRGIHRKPGGWRLPLTNIVMGPPIFAPLLYGVPAYLGLVASLLGRADQPHAFGRSDHAEVLRRGDHPDGLPRALIRAATAITYRHPPIGFAQDMREGRFQRQMALAAAASAFFSGFEASYSHYRSGFRYKAQWTPVLLAPLLMVAGLRAARRARTAQTWLPALSVLAVADGAVGVGYHARGVLQRPGGLALPLYNVAYGPPLFAPLLFAAAGLLGLLASLLRRKP
jgi:hypothetical protein